MIVSNNLIFGKKYSNPLAVGLIHAYKFEELSGTTLFDSVGSLNLTMANSPTFNQTAKVNKGIRITSEFTLPNFGGNANLSSFPFSYKFWFNFESISTSRFFFSNPTSANYCGVTIFSTNQTLTVRFGNNGGRFASHRKDYTTGNVITTTGWHQIHLNVTGFGVFELFIDGIIYSGSYTVSGSATTVNLINAFYELMQFGSGLAVGTWDELYLRNTTMSSSEVLEIYNLENAGTSII